MTPIPEIKFEEPTPPLPECDQALGLYMRSWNQLENALLTLFHKLLGTHWTATRILYASGISSQTLREIMLALAGQRLQTADYETLEGLLSSTKKATTKRNKLVHGTWQLAIKVNEGKPNTASWQRFYQPTDPKLFEAMLGGVLELGRC